MKQKLLSLKVHEDDYSNVPFICPNDTLYYEPVGKDLPHNLDYCFVVGQGKDPQIKQVNNLIGDIYELTYAGSILDKDTIKENTYIMPLGALKKSGLIVGVVRELKREFKSRLGKEKQWNTFTNIIKAF